MTNTERDFKEMIEEILVKHRESATKVNSWQYMEQKKSIEDLQKSVCELREEIKPVSEFIKTAGSLRKGALWFSAFILAITGIIYGLKELIGFMIKK